MKWIWKALLQLGVSCLPRSLGGPFYYFLQRRVGSLRYPEPFSRFDAGARMGHLMRQHGQSVEGAKILELGTGWRLNAPLALWLVGADVVTVDLNAFLKPDLVLEDVKRLVADEERVRNTLGPSLNEARWETLVAISHREFKLSDLAGLEYHAPQDASRLSQYDNETFDATVSYAVLEHIPGDVLVDIFREAARVTHRRGVGVHMVDHSDHFWQADPSITAVNFLRFSEMEWRFWGGNRFAYCNRLRSSEVGQLFVRSGFDILEQLPRVDEQLALNIEVGSVPLWGRFKTMDAQDVATLDTWFVLRPASST